MIDRQSKSITRKRCYHPEKRDLWIFPYQKSKTKLFPSSFISIITVITLLFSINLPVSAEIIEETGSLRGFLAGDCETAAYDNWISHCCEGVASPGYNHYGPEGFDDQAEGFGTFTIIDNLVNSEAIINQWRNILDLFIEGDIYTVADLLADSLNFYHYETVIFHDTEFNRDYYILREQLDYDFVDDGGTPDFPDDDVVGSFRNGWGIYILSPDSERPYLNIQTPHPGDDFLGVQCVVELFLRLDAGSMNINGSGREVVWSHDGNYSNAKSYSDPSRNYPSIYQIFVEELNDKYKYVYPPGLMIFQIHSYDITHTNKNPVIVSAGQYHTYIHKPLFDRIDHEHDVINLTDAVPVPENLLGNHPAVPIEDYYWLNYDNGFPFYYYYEEGGRVQIPRATSLRCDPDNIQENYLHDNDYPDGAIIENFFHVEFNEFPDVLEDAGLSWEDLYGAERPPVYQSFSSIFQFYESAFQAIENWFDVYENPVDETIPGQVTNLALNQVNDTTIELTWDVVEDGNFLTYEVLIDTPQVTDASTSIWDYRDDFNLIQMDFDGPTLVTSLPDGIEWQIAVRAVDLAGNAGPLSNEVSAITVDNIGIGLTSSTFEEFPLAAWPAWCNVKIDDPGDLDSAWVEWQISVLERRTANLSPIGNSSILGAPLDVPAEEVAVGDTIYWRIQCRDKSFTGNPSRTPEDGYFWFVISDNEPGLFSSDLEMDNGGLLPYGQWEWGTPTYGPEAAHSGENLWGTDLDAQYNPNSNAQLRVTDINLGGYGPLQFTWWQWYDYQPGRDGGFVRYVYNDQEYDLEPLNGYPSVISSQSNPENGSPAFSGSMTHWHPVSIDLRPMFGLNDIEIVFYSATDLGGQSAGWYIDDIRITEIVNINPPLACELISPENGIDLPELESDFSWHTSYDPDLYTDAPTYELVFNLNEDTVTIFTGLDTTTFVYLDSLHLRAYEPSQVLWWVNTVSQGDKTPSEIRVINTPPFNEVNEQTLNIPSEFAINSVWPNPFNPTVTLNYSLPVKSEIRIEILNILGQRVDLLENKVKSAGNYSLTWNAENFASSVYFIRMHTEGFTGYRKIVLLK